MGSHQELKRPSANRHGGVGTLQRSSEGFATPDVVMAWNSGSDAIEGALASLTG